MVNLLSNPGMNGMKIYQFQHLGNLPGITHGIITRHGEPVRENAMALI